MRSYERVLNDITEVQSTNAENERKERPTRIIAEMLLDIRELLVAAQPVAAKAEEQEAPPKKKSPVPLPKDNATVSS